MNPAIPDGPIEGPTAWYGADLARRADWIFRLGREDLAEIDAAVRTFSASGVPLTLRP